METFSALLASFAGNSPVIDEFPSQRPVTRSFDVFLDLGLYQHLSKQWRCRWFERPRRSLWRHCNGCPGLCAIWLQPVRRNELTHWGRDKMAGSFQTTFQISFLEWKWISLRMSLKFVSVVWINNIPASVQIMAWCRICVQPLSEAMVVNLHSASVIYPCAWWLRKLLVSILNEWWRSTAEDNTTF